MSDEPKRRSDPSHVTIPPELKPFMGREQFPEVRRRDEAELDPEVSAGLAAIDAAFSAPVPPAPTEPPRGVGNVQVYVGATTLPPGNGAAPVAQEPKVALAIGDAPRVLPAGDRSAPTMEVRVGAFRDAVPDEDAAPPSRTVGGGTERLPVLRDAGAKAAKDEPKAASPWTKDAGPSSARAEDLPSSLRPTDTPAQGSKQPASVTDRRRAGAGTAITIALCAVAAAIGLRALTTTTTAPESTASHSSVPSATPNDMAPAVRTVTRAPVSSGVPEVFSSSPPAMAATAAPTTPATIAEPHPTVRTPATAEDPYDAAARPLPPVTAQPQVTAPIPPPAVTTSAHPSTPPPAPTVVLPGGDKLNL